MVFPNQFALQEQSITEDSNSIIVNKVFFTSPPPFYVYYNISLRKCKDKIVWHQGAPANAKRTPEGVLCVVCSDLNR